MEERGGSGHGARLVHRDGCIVRGSRVGRVDAGGRRSRGAAVGGSASARTGELEASLRFGDELDAIARAVVAEAGPRDVGPSRARLADRPDADGEQGTGVVDVGAPAAPVVALDGALEELAEAAHIARRERGVAAGGSGAEALAGEGTIANCQEMQTLMGTGGCPRPSNLARGAPKLFRPRFRIVEGKQSTNAAGVSRRRSPASRVAAARGRPRWRTAVPAGRSGATRWSGSRASTRRWSPALARRSRPRGILGGCAPRVCQQRARRRGGRWIRVGGPARGGRERDGDAPVQVRRRARRGAPPRVRHPPRRPPRGEARARGFAVSSRVARPRPRPRRRPAQA